MIIVDSSVWIDKLVHRTTLQTQRLEELIEAELDIGVGDLVMMEVLQGVRGERPYRATQSYLAQFDRVQVSDWRVAEAAARNYRLLRDRGITIRKTIDTLIAPAAFSTDCPYFTAIGTSIPSASISACGRRWTFLPE